MMPTILLTGPYRLFFYSSDGNEPIHVHIERDDKIAKFCLQPLRMSDSGGFKSPELSKIIKILETNQDRLLEAWHEYFGN